VLFCFRVPVWGLGYPVGPTPAPRPRRAQLWLDRAALCGGLRQSPNRPIADHIRRRRERPERPRVRRIRLRRIGVSAAAESAPPSAVQVDAAALGRKQWPFRIRRGAAAARRRHGRPGQGHVTLRCAAQPNRNRNGRARAGARRSDGRNLKGSAVRGGREAGAFRPPPPAPAIPRLAPHPSLRTLYQRRCSLSELGDPAGRDATAHTALAL
jgi:hypothetical protein